MPGMLIFHRMKGQYRQPSAGVCEIFGRGCRGTSCLSLFSSFAWRIRQRGRVGRNPDGAVLHFETPEPDKKGSRSGDPFGEMF